MLILRRLVIHAIQQTGNVIEENPQVRFSGIATSVSRQPRHATPYWHVSIYRDHTICCQVSKRYPFLLRSRIRNALVWLGKSRKWGSSHYLHFPNPSHHYVQVFSWVLLHLLHHETISRCSRYRTSRTVLPHQIINGK